MPKRKFYLARIELQHGKRQLVTPSEIQTTLRRAIDPDVVAERYGRVWRMSKPQGVAGGLIQGKLGFVSKGLFETVTYDENEKDYVQEEGEKDQGDFCHFLVSVDHGLVFFEQKPPNILESSFTGAFQKLIREKDSGFRVVSTGVETSFSKWRSDIDRITSVSTTIHPPNPNWSKETEEARRLIEGSSASKVKIEASVDTSGKESLQVDDNLIGHSLAHAERGYGTAKVIGTKKGVKRIFLKGISIDSVEIDIDNEEGSESILEKMRKHFDNYLNE